MLLTSRPNEEKEAILDVLRIFAHFGRNRQLKQIINSTGNRLVTRLTQSADFQPPSAEPFNTDFDSDFLFSNTETQLISKSTRLLENLGVTNLIADWG